MISILCSLGYTVTVVFSEKNSCSSIPKNDAIAKLVDSIPIGDPKKIPEVREILSDRATYKDGVLTIRGKDANEYVTEWTAKGAFGYDFLAGTQHSGGGASGGSNTDIPVSGKLDGTKAEQEAYIKAKFNL